MSTDFSHWTTVYVTSIRNERGALVVLTTATRSRKKKHPVKKRPIYVTRIVL